MPWRTICPNPTTFREVTLDELLAEPVVRLLMARDGVGEDDIRRLADQAREQLRFKASSRLNANVGGLSCAEREAVAATHHR